MFDIDDCHIISAVLAVLAGLMAVLFVVINLIAGYSFIVEFFMALAMLLFSLALAVFILTMLLNRGDGE